MAGAALNLTDTMIEFLYGCGVAAAGYSAWLSGSAVLRRLALVLFCGWLIYVNAHPGTLSPITFNICLDISILLVVSLTYLDWKGTKYSSCCHAIAGILVIMLCLHVAKSVDLLAFLSLYAYYFVYNALFLGQLLSIIAYSAFAISRNEKNTSHCKDTKQWQHLQRESSGQKVILITSSKA